MTLLSANGLRHHVEQMGPAHAVEPTVVCLHGIGTDSLASWYFTVAKPLSDAGYRVVMYDLRGHGRTERPASGYTLDDFADDLLGLLDQLNLTEPVYLLGNSFGGTVAFAFAMRHPERTGGLAVIESEPASPAWAAKMAANLTKAATELARPEAYPWITVRYGLRTSKLAKAAARLLHSTTIVQDVPASRLPSVAEVRSIDCPVLAIYGARSDLAVQAPVLETGLVRCETVIVPGQEHSVLVEVPDTVRDLVLPWLAAHDRSLLVGADDR